MRTFLATAAAALLISQGGSASASDKQATPADYTTVVPTLQPGDTLHLAGGAYKTLSISGLNGSASAWITIVGPDSGPPATFVADPGPCCNTIEISDSSYVALVHVTVDGNHVDGAFGVSAKSGVVHDIRIENCDLINHDAGQQTDGISTKVPTWGWVIRGNRIKNPGTGLYLGNSDGSDPFIGGLIEDNLVEDPIGYCMEIKFQNTRPSAPGMPTGPSTTIIRNNVFIKNDAPSPDGDRPNLLVGGFPSSGPGSQDRYEIYGNLFFHNPREALLQASGRVTIHDNIFVDTPQSALNLRDHDLPLVQAYVYNNTIYGVSNGIHFGSPAPGGDAVVGNLVFSDSPISGTITDQRDNIVNPVASAAQFVKAPSMTLGQMDFYPLAGTCQGAAMDLTKFAADTDYAADFNGASKGTFTFRGAYAGEGQNPGWQLGDGNKSTTTTGSSTSSAGPGSGAGAGASGSPSSGVGFSSGVGGGGGASPNDDAPGQSSGCGCHVANTTGTSTAALIGVLGALFVSRRRGVPKQRSSTFGTRPSRR